jgi:uncharacterized protein YjbI with pentapeptide repeats
MRRGTSRSTRADLYDADLSSADLSYADLRGANLGDADLRGAYERPRDKKTSRLITNEELEQQSAYLNDATMPNGQEYEDWRKNREGDGENE